MNVLFGTQFYDAAHDAVRRQAACAASLLALRDADLVNIQWRTDCHQQPGVETLAVLERDAAAVVGVGGRRKPIVVDLIDALATEAARRGLRYIALVNGDIVVTQAAVDRIRGGARQTIAFSRMDVDSAGRGGPILTWGLDAFAFDVAWWRANRGRFRSYVLGELCFDNVFTAIMMTHGDGAIENRHGEIRHEQHLTQSGSAYSRYNAYLAALDAPYFTLWVRYVAALDEMRRAGASEAAEHEMLKRTFVWTQSPAAAIWHAGRCARARWRYTRDRARLIATAGASPR